MPVAGVGTAKTVYTNVVLSSNPCPDCKEANGKMMYMEAWKNSKYGLPGSDKRICDGNCHCILVPQELMEEFPEIDKRTMLRGDEGTDIGKTVDIYPNEVRLQQLMDEYNARIGKLPPEIYDMPLEKVADYLENLLKKLPPTGAVPGVPKVNIHERMTNKEKLIIESYTDKDYKLMRQYLKAGDIERENLIGKWGKTTFTRIEKASNEFNKLFEKYINGVRNKTLYRGLSELKEDVYQAIKAHKPGEIIKIDKTVTSWSENKDIASSFAGGKRSVVFNLKEGRKYTKEFDIARYSLHDELETIIKDTDFKVIKIKETRIWNPHDEEWIQSLDVFIEEIGK